MGHTSRKVGAVKRSLAAVLLATASLLSLGVVSATAADNYVTVTPQNFDAVFSNHTERAESSYQFRFGPATPPLGVGSLQLVTADSTGKQQHLEPDQQGTPLSAITGMGYSTYREQGQLLQDTALNMEILTTPPTGYTTLVFEPVYNFDQGLVANDLWQTWDAYNGGTARWWSTRDIPGVCAFNCFVPWSVIVAANPNAVVIDYGVNQGSGNPGLTADTDALKIRTATDSWTYDFEPSAEQCKNGGYAAFDPPFKNQGQCVAATHRGSKD